MQIVQWFPGKAPALDNVGLRKELASPKDANVKMSHFEGSKLYHRAPFL
jgi:hypothetical protein